jgi:hypothetical protein
MVMIAKNLYPSKKLTATSSGGKRQQAFLSNYFHLPKFTLPGIIVSKAFSYLNQL